MNVAHTSMSLTIMPSTITIPAAADDADAAAAAADDADALAKLIIGGLETRVLCRRNDITCCLCVYKRAAIVIGLMDSCQLLLLLCP